MQKSFLAHLLLALGLTLAACQPTAPTARPATLAAKIPVRATQTPPASIAPTGLLMLLGESPSQVSLDERYVYWFGKEGINRYPLASQLQDNTKIELVATSHYPEGELSQFPMVHQGDWLLFFDSAFPAISSTWQLRALNKVTQAQRTLAESQDRGILYGFAAANQRVVWAWGEQADQRICTYEAVLSMSNLTTEPSTKQSTELNRSCFAEHSWRAVSMDGDRLVAEYWSYGAKQEDIKGDIVLFNLAATVPTQFTFLTKPPGASYNASPTITGDWVTWQHGEEIRDNCVLYNLHLQAMQPLPPGLRAQNCQSVWASEGWLYPIFPVEQSALPLYQPERGRTVTIHPKTPGTVQFVTVAHNRLALVVRMNPEQTVNIKSAIEWIALETFYRAH